jgi:hypothetical protein
MIQMCLTKGSPAVTVRSSDLVDRGGHGLDFDGEGTPMVDGIDEGADVMQKGMVESRVWLACPCASRGIVEWRPERR